MKYYSAADILPAYFEFKAMAPDNKDWNEYILEKNPPRYYRLLRLKSLLRAFGLETDLSELEYGYFLIKRNISEFKFLQHELSKIIKNEESQYEKKEISNFNMSDVEMIYTQFFGFLYSVHRVKSFNQGLMEAGTDSAQFMYITTRNCIEKINNIKELKKIEQVIARIIDPKKRNISETELIEKFNFPDVDLLDIDIDWM